MVEGLSEIPDEEIERVEAEKSPETPSYFDVAIILGSGTRPNFEGEMTKLSIDSKLRVLAGGEIALKGKAQNLILSGGKTAGPNNSSEAEVMKSYLLKKFPELSDFPISIEDSSIDSIENAKLVAELLGEDYEGTVLLVTNGFHMLRAAGNFRHQGLTVQEIPAEEVVCERSKHHQKFINDYLKSVGLKKKRAIEWVLRGITKIDPDGKILTALASKLRHGNELDDKEEKQR